jgi:hypothetical protein
VIDVPKRIAATFVDSVSGCMGEGLAVGGVTSAHIREVVVDNVEFGVYRVETFDRTSIDGRDPLCARSIRSRGSGGQDALARRGVTSESSTCARDN